MTLDFVVNNAIKILETRMSNIEQSVAELSRLARGEMASNINNLLRVTADRAENTGSSLAQIRRDVANMQRNVNHAVKQLDERNDAFLDMASRTLRPDTVEWDADFIQSLRNTGPLPTFVTVLDGVDGDGNMTVHTEISDSGVSA
jgi:hypothetical protein